MLAPLLALRFLTVLSRSHFSALAPLTFPLRRLCPTPSPRPRTQRPWSRPAVPSQPQPSSPARPKTGPSYLSPGRTPSGGSAWREIAPPSPPPISAPTTRPQPHPIRTTAGCPAAARPSKLKATHNHPDQHRARNPCMRYPRLNPHDAGLGGAYRSRGECQGVRLRLRVATPTTPMNDHRRTPGTAGVRRALRLPSQRALARH